MSDLVDLLGQIKPSEIPNIIPVDIPDPPYYKLIELSCKLLDDGKMEARGTEVLTVHGAVHGRDGDFTPHEGVSVDAPDGTPHEGDDKLQLVTVGTPDQFTGSGVYSKPPEKVLTRSERSWVDFASSMAKHQLQKCFAVPSV